MPLSACVLPQSSLQVPGTSGGGLVGGGAKGGRGGVGGAGGVYWQSEKPAPVMSSSDAKMIGLPEGTMFDVLES